MQVSQHMLDEAKRQVEEAQRASQVPRVLPPYTQIQYAAYHRMLRPRHRPLTHVGLPKALTLMAQAALQKKALADVAVKSAEGAISLCKVRHTHEDIV